MFMFLFLAEMAIKNKESYLMKGSEVLKFFGMGATAVYRWLKHLENHKVLEPIILPGLKRKRWKREEVMQVANNKDLNLCPEFEINN